MTHSSQGGQIEASKTKRGLEEWEGLAQIEKKGIPGRGSVMGKGTVYSCREATRSYGRVLSRGVAQSDLFRGHPGY